MTYFKTPAGMAVLFLGASVLASFALGGRLGEAAQTYTAKLATLTV